MLSAFSPHALVELKQRDKSKIESVLAYGNRVLLGLSTGSLRVYRVNEPVNGAGKQDEVAAEERPGSQARSRPVDLLKELEKFSKYKIEKLALFKEANTLLSLSNGYVHLHNLQSYELQETLAKTKGASSFAITSNATIRSSTGVNMILSRLAVAVKRRLLLWSWHDGELQPETSEMTLVTGIKSLTWATETRLAAGLTSSYVMVDIETSTITDIVGPGSIGGAPGQDGGRFSGAGVASMSYLGMSSPTPLATKLTEGEMLLAKDINTLFIDMEGSSLGRRQIPWAVAPEAVGYSHPYLLALQATKGTLELRNPETLTLLQTIALPSASQLHPLKHNTSLANTGRDFLVLSDRCLWQMKALDYESQIDALVERSRLDEAISLLGMLEGVSFQDKAGRMKEIKMQKAQLLFDGRKFRESIDLFTEISAPPETVINLFPPFIAGRTSQSSQQSQQIVGDETTDGSSANPQGSPKTSPSKSGSATGHSSKRSTDATAYDEAEDQMTSASHPILEGKDLKVATEELRGFLVSARTKMKKVLNSDGHLKGDDLEEVPRADIGLLLVKQSFDAASDQEQLLNTAKLVDTTLFRAYMFVSPSFAGPLFRIDNFCDPDVVNEKLVEAGRYNDLVDYFYGKKLHRQALELLRKFGDTNKEDEAAPQLSGPQRTVAYLQNLPPGMIELILQFSEWPLKRDSKLAMDIFMADSENAETLPRQPVLDFLQGIDKILAVKYLEHIIHELNDTTPVFHQRLVDVYIQGLKSNFFANEEEKSAWKEKVLDFLRTSKSYQAYKALTQLSSDDANLYEARAIVLSNMGQYKQALEIYVFKMQDANKAEEFCNQIFLTETTAPSSPKVSGQRSSTDPEDAPPSIYHTLLSLYLSPPPPRKPQWAPALNILAKHGARMPASSTLHLIPEVLPIKDLESYFRGRIRNANTVMNEARVIAGLRNTLAFGEEAKLRLGDGVPGGNAGRSRRVVITEDRVCGVCYKRFGGSAIKVLPDNTVIHYGCSTR